MAKSSNRTTAEDVSLSWRPAARRARCLTSSSASYRRSFAGPTIVFPGAPVRIDGDLVAKARYLAAREGVELSLYVSSILRPVIEKPFTAAGKELLDQEAARKQEGGK